MVTALSRWIYLLGRNTLDEAQSIIFSDSRYLDLTSAQYLEAMRFLKEKDLVPSRTDGRFDAIDETEVLKLKVVSSIVLDRQPLWFGDAKLPFDVNDMPVDLQDLVDGLSINPHLAMARLGSLSGRVDLARRQSIGDAGEDFVVNLLNTAYPGSADRVSLVDDALGFDISFRHDRVWHLEVKSSVARQPRDFYLSRNEYETSLADPQWRLVLVALSRDLVPQGLYTLATNIISQNAPTDASAFCSWRSALYVVQCANYQPGLTFLPRDANQLIHPINIL